MPDYEFECPYLRCAWPKCHTTNDEAVRHPSCRSASWAVADRVRREVLRLIKPKKSGGEG